MATTVRGVSFDPHGARYIGHFNGPFGTLFIQADETSAPGSIWEGTGNAGAVAADPFGNVVVVLPDARGDRIQKWWQKF